MHGVSAIVKYAPDEARHPYESHIIYEKLPRLPGKCMLPVRSK